MLLFSTKTRTINVILLMSVKKLLFGLLTKVQNNFSVWPYATQDWKTNGWDTQYWHFDAVSSFCSVDFSKLLWLETPGKLLWHSKGFRALNLSFNRWCICCHYPLGGTRIPFFFFLTLRLLLITHAFVKENTPSLTIFLWIWETNIDSPIT